MSSVVISWSRTGYASPEEIYSNNKSWLAGEFEKILSDIRKKIMGLDEGFKLEALSDVKSLEELANNLAAGYTLQTLHSADHIKIVNNMVDTFNQNALKLKTKIEFLQIEGKEILKRVENCYQEIDRAVSEKLSSNILPGYKEKFEGIRGQLKTIGKLASIKEKERKINLLLNEMQKLVEVYEFAKTIDLTSA